LILQGDNRKIMAKMLEVLGLVLVTIMSLGFMGILQPTIEPGLSPLFGLFSHFPSHFTQNSPL